MILYESDSLIARRVGSSYLSAHRWSVEIKLKKGCMVLAFRGGTDFDKAVYIDSMKESKIREFKKIGNDTESYS